MKSPALLCPHVEHRAFPKKFKNETRGRSETEKGQIYIPRINWLLLVAVLYIVFAFRSSSALAWAYAVAVTGTMVITSIMAFFVMWKCWQWKVASAALVNAPFPPQTRAAGLVVAPHL